MAGDNIWTSSGPSGGTIEALVLDPNNPQVLYAGGPGGVYKSVSSGESWALAKANIYGRALVVDPTNSQTVYAGGGGIWKSTDGGNSWTAANNGLTNTNIWSLVIDPVNPL